MKWYQSLNFQPLAHGLYGVAMIWEFALKAASGMKRIIHETGENAAKVSRPMLIMNICRSMLRPALKRQKPANSDNSISMVDKNKLAEIVATAMKVATI